MNDSSYAHDTRCTSISLHLLGGFSIAADGHEVRLPFSAQRVLAALALRPTLCDRTQLGGILYPQGRQNQVSASLRSALWRAKREVGGPLIESHGPRLCLAQDVTVDLRCWLHRARIITSAPKTEYRIDEGGEVEVLSQELLPTWGEEWLLLDQQRWDQLRLHALERLAERFLEGGRHMEALEAALAAVSIEPYRESAHRALIRTFIAEGNSASAVAHYQRYRRLLTNELGLRPTSQMKALVDGLTRE
jgi:DNA-binding SARP family transcriptional activator